MEVHDETIEVSWVRTQIGASKLLEFSGYELQEIVPVALVSLHRCLFCDGAGNMKIEYDGNEG